MGPQAPPPCTPYLGGWVLPCDAPQQLSHHVLHLHQGLVAARQLLLQKGLGSSGWATTWSPRSSPAHSLQGSYPFPPPPLSAHQGVPSGGARAPHLCTCSREQTGTLNAGESSFFFFETGPPYVAQDGLELPVLSASASQSECWDGRHEPHAYPWQVVLETDSTGMTASTATP
jgi:hypothetical protein